MFGQPHQVGAVVRGGAPDLCEPVPEGDRFSHKLEEQIPQVDRSGVKPLYNEIGYVELSWSKWDSSHSNSPLPPPIRNGRGVLAIDSHPSANQEANGAELKPGE